MIPTPNKQTKKSTTVFIVDQLKEEEDHPAELWD
jgi:hypothetical protein